MLCVPAGEIRVLYSHVESHLAAEAAESPPVSVQDVLGIFRQHLSTRQCDVFGYLSIEGDMVILVMPITKYPTPMQVSLFSCYIGIFCARAVKGILLDRDV